MRSASARMLPRAGSRFHGEKCSRKGALLVGVCVADVDHTGSSEPDHRGYRPLSGEAPRRRHGLPFLRARSLRAVVTAAAKPLWRGWEAIRKAWLARQAAIQMTHQGGCVRARFACFSFVSFAPVATRRARSLEASRREEARQGRRDLEGIHVTGDPSSQLPPRKPHTHDYGVGGSMSFDAKRRVEFWPCQIFLLK